MAWPEVDSDDSGDAAVVWEQDAQVVGRRISADGQLVGPLQTLSTSAPASTPVVAVSPDGDAMAAWTEIRDGSWYAVARQLPYDGSMGAPITLGSTDPGAGIGVDRSGRFVVAWVSGSTSRSPGSSRIPPPLRRCSHRRSRPTAYSGWSGSASTASETRSSATAPVAVLILSCGSRAGAEPER